MRALFLPMIACFSTATAQQAIPTGGIINGRATYLPKPVISDKARTACASGEVRVLVHVGTSGKVVSAKVVSGPALLRMSAVKAAKQVRFAPVNDLPPISFRGTLVYDIQPPAECSKNHEVFTRIITCEICSRQFIVLPKPEYPTAAVSLNLSGNVQVEILIGKDGNVMTAKAISGHPLLRPAAEKAALKARFEPQMLGGNPVRATASIVYNFVR